MRNGQCTTPAPRAAHVAPRIYGPRTAHRGSRIADRGTTYMTLRVLALVLAMGIAGSVAGAEVIDRILAVVARELITLSDVTAAIRLGLVGQATGQDAIRAGLDTLIARQLELSEANRDRPPEPAPAQVADRLSAVRARFPARAAFTQTLAQSGLSE